MSNKVFKVVKIVNEYRVVINAGKEDGIKVGNVFEIYQEGETVMDPDTKENLGTMDYIKATVEVIDLFPKMCACRNTDTTTVPSAISQAVLGFAGALENYGQVTKVAKLNVNVEDISGGYEDIDKKIHVGDKVRLV